MTVTQQLSRFYEFLDRPLFGWSRVVLALLVIPLVLAFGEPLWKISLHAPQYPNGLWMDVYMHKVEGGNSGQHIKEINTLNHYIGMHKIDRGELADLDWIPFAVGLLVVLALRCAAIGNVRSLIDLVALTSYVTVFAFGRFIYKMYVFGHNLDPSAPLKIKPFTPAIFGTKQIANFTTTSMPQLGSLLVGIFATGITVLLCWHLIAGRVAMLRAQQAATTDV
jgi:hypothetical protein